MITINEHPSMKGVVELTCKGRTFQFAGIMVESGPWFKYPSNEGMIYTKCDTIIEALFIVKMIVGP